MNRITSAISNFFDEEPIAAIVLASGVLWGIIISSLSALFCSFVWHITWFSIQYFPKGVPAKTLFLINTHVAVFWTAFAVTLIACALYFWFCLRRRFISELMQ